MKKCKLFSAAVMGTAAVIVLAGFLTACKQGNGPGGGGNTPAPEKVTVTVTGDENVKSIKPEKLTADKGTDWKTLKTKITVKYKDGYEAAGFKLENKNGAELKDSHKFDKNTTVFAVSKPKSAPAPEKITITVKGDDGITVAEENTFQADKNAEWKNIKDSATGKITVKENCEFAEWRLNDKTGELLTDTKVFAADTAVFAVTKSKTEPSPNTVNYKVEHWQQNITNNEYTKAEADTETKTGKAGEYTAAQAKTYAGFTAKPVTQEKIKADGSTVIKVYYDRNIITLTLDLNGGTASTPLEDGEGGKKLLKGKFGATVTLEDPAKSGLIFAGWNPDLPKTFPEKSPAEVYTAQWDNSLKVKISGDERTEIPAGSQIELTAATTWENIKAQVLAKVNLKSEWQGGDYEVYEWRLKDGTGEKLTDGYPVNKSITVYAVTNYAKFNIADNKISGTKGYTGDEPRGKIIIPDGITEIGDSAFYSCTGLTSIIMPESLIKIGDSAFAYCAGLTSVNLPENLTGMGASAFSGCTGLTSITLPERLTKIGSSAFSGCTGLKSVTMPESLMEIGDSAFRSCTGLTNVNLPESLTKIGSSVFSGCAGLKSINLPESLTEIGDSAFTYCSGLTDVVLPTRLTQISDFVFSGCTGLTSITLSESLTKIGGSAFAYCAGLKNVTLPERLIEIGSSAFASCKGLISITLPKRLTKVGSSAFTYCSGLTNVYLPESLTEIGTSAFAGCTGLTSVTLPERLTEISTSAFSGCTGLTNVTLPERLTEIGTSAFAYCTGLISVTLPKRLTKIGASAFAYCEELTSVDLPANLTVIGIRAFEECSKLTSAVFADKNGWAVYDDKEYNNKHSDIQQSDLENTATAAKYLSDTHSWKYWKKN